MTGAELKVFVARHRAEPDDRPNLLRGLTAEAPTTLSYNLFLFRLARELKPGSMLETGTDRGRSAAHLAVGNPDGKVVTIDIDPACSKNALDLGIPNITTVTANALDYAKQVPNASLDLLFLDSLHTYEHVSAEWRAFRPKVKDGGIVFFDDIHLDTGMDRFWKEVREEKFDISELHFSGFGAVVV